MPNRALSMLTLFGVRRCSTDAQYMIRPIEQSIRLVIKDQTSLKEANNISVIKHKSNTPPATPPMAITNNRLSGFLVNKSPLFESNALQVDKESPLELDNTRGWLVMDPSLF